MDYYGNSEKFGSSPVDQAHWKVIEENCGFNKSEFFYFGILPRVCIHSLIDDHYSHMYTPRKSCDCGCEEWIESTMPLANFMGEECMFKEVQRCKDCNDVRLADHIGKEE